MRPIKISPIRPSGVSTGLYGQPQLVDGTGTDLSKAALGTWHFAVALIPLTGLVSLFYGSVLTGLLRDWRSDPNYSHGFLIPLMSAYVAWLQRENLRRVPQCPSPMGLGVLGAGVALLILGGVSAELFTMRVSLLPILAGLILWLFGKEHLKFLAFPILYLLFMIPLPAIIFNVVAFQLQLFSSSIATHILQLLQVPVLREGNVITLPTTTLEVVDACSGIRSLVTLSALATMFAYFGQRTIWRAWLLALSTIPIAIIANASRIAGTGLLSQYYGPSIAEGFFHTFSGWFLFVIATLSLGIVAALLSRLPQGSQAASRSTVPMVVYPPREKHTSRNKPDRIAWGRVMAAAALLIVGIACLPILSTKDAIPLRRTLDRFPAQVGPWQGVTESLPPAIQKVVGATDYLMRFYTVPGKGSILLYVGYYETQRQGQTIHSPQNCLPGSGWNFLSREYLTVQMPGYPDPVKINYVLVAKGDMRQIVLYWYQERGRIIASEYMAKVYMIRDAIARKRTDGALVRVSIPVPEGSEEDTRRLLLEFTRLIFPSLMEFLPA